MIVAQPLADAGQIMHIIGNPSVWQYVAPDGVELSAELIAAIMARGPVVGIYDNDVLVGCFCFTQINPAVYEIHTCLLPTCRGDRAREACREAMLWLFSTTGVLRIITRVPAFNKAAHRFALDCGMAPEYQVLQSFMWCGELHDVEFMALTLHSWVWHNAKHFAEHSFPASVPPYAVMSGVISRFGGGRANALAAEFDQIMGLSDQSGSAIIH